MSNPLGWHRFMFKDWDGDERVKLMTFEQVGVYWLLCVRQMIEGSIPANLEDISLVLGKPYGDAKYLAERVWPKVSPHFVPVEGNPDRLHHPKLTKVMEEDLARTKAFSQGGKNSALKRGFTLKKTDEDDFSEISTTPGPSIDMTPLVKLYPFRKNKGGRDQGIKLLQTIITSPEDFDLMKEAILEYTRELDGKDHEGRKMNYKFDRFVRDEWTSYVTDTARKRVANKYSNGTTVVAETQAAEVKTNRLAELPPGHNPPWVPGRYATEKQKADLAAYWTEQRKQLWIEGKPHHNIPAETEKENVTNVGN